MKEFIERKKRIHQDSLNHNLSDASFQTDLTKMYKPLVDTNNMIKESLKGPADKLSEGMLAVTNSSQALTSSPQALTSSSFPHTTPEMLTDDKQKFMNVGKIAARYLKMFTSNKNQMDKTYGIHLKEGELFLGKDLIMINDDDINIGDKTYYRTVGLWELITKNDPDKAIYNEEDVKNYRENINKKVWLVLTCEMKCPSILTGEAITRIVPFRSNTGIVLEATDLEKFYNRAIETILENMIKYNKMGSINYNQCKFFYPSLSYS